MNDLLKVLADNRDNILLAEIGAMIHNIGKMSKEHLIELKFDYHKYFGDWLYDLLVSKPNVQNDKDWKEEWKHAQKAYDKFYPRQLKSLLSDLKVSFNVPPLNDRQYELREFSSLIIKNLYNKQKLDNVLGNKTSLLGKLLEESHSRAVGGDKGFILNDICTNQQERNFIHLSSAFGYEADNISKRNINIEKDCFLFNLQTRLQKVYDFLHQDKNAKTDSEKKFWTQFYTDFQETLQKHLSPYIADTRYPVNDIDLYSFHHATAGFFKAGIARILLDPLNKLNYENISNFEWKLLTVRYNGLDYMMQSGTVNDILGKQRVLKWTLDAVKSLLEVTYPIAYEIYRDENGSVFLFPDLKNSEDEVYKEICENIEIIFKEVLKKDIKPVIHLLSEPKRQLTQMGKIISENTPRFNQFYPDFNPGKPTRNVDLCQSCHQRFIGHGLTGIDLEKATVRKICGVCFERRENRAENWWEDENDKSIWMDEIADDSGQVALITGKFELQNWLDGWLLNSMLGKTFREVIEKRHSLIKEYKENLEKEITKGINCTFQPNATNELRDKITETIQELKALIESYKEEEIIKNSERLNELQAEANMLIESLEKEFTDAGISISYTERPFVLFDYLKSKIRTSIDSLSPYLSFNPNNQYKDISEFDNFLKKEKDSWEIYRGDNKSCFLFVNMKPASFARLSRIWQQTREFNKYISSAIVESCMSSIKRRRQHIEATTDPGKNKFKTSHVYEFKQGNVSFSLYCTKGNENDNGNLKFVSASNLDYLKKQLQFNWKDVLTKGTTLLETEEKLQIKIEFVQESDKAYYPYIPILAEPQLFMFLVPAAHAVDIASMISRQYNEQFSKVKNRLPLNIAVVFAKRKQPLYTIMEAGRKMIEGFDNSPLLWKVQNDATFNDTVKSVVLDLQAKRHEKDTNAHNLKWEISTRLGDPARIDYYYPYFYTHYTQEKEIGNRIDIFQAPLLPGKDSPWYYLCHVKELKKGDHVYITPGFFDFEFLEVPGRRFDLYCSNNKRLPRKTKPFLLDDLDRLQKAWELISNGGLTNTQFRGLLEVIESRRESWLNNNPSDETFSKFVEYTIRAQAKEWYQKLKPEEQELIREFALKGYLLDVFELFIKILKKKVEGE
ncbi:MAG: CRISPR-associated protein Csx11 [Spirochaetales bacterium]|nr:CRISPR-associated protein Csx11 [Spirochaetales bacterium]